MKPSLHRLIICAVLSLAVLAAAAPYAVAASIPSKLKMQTEDERLVTWDLSAETVTNLNDAEIMEARGNVILKRGTDYLRADFARYYLTTNWVYLEGDVQVHMGKDSLKAESAEFDLRSKVGWLKNGTIFMAGPHTYLSGTRIDKHWGDVYSLEGVKVTVCDGDVPAWSFTAEEAVVEVDGYARLTGARFQIQDTPVAYAPYFILPVKTKRQSGLLTPEYGSSTSKGLYYNQPFFWAINDSSDLTFNEMFMDKRGFMHGLEYRTRPNTETAGWLRFDWLYDKQRVTNDAHDKYYKDDGLIRNNHERYWLRGMFDARMPDPAWRIKVDIDYTSDQYFLREFKDEFGGFTRSQDELFDWFSRDLREKSEDRVSKVLITRDWDRFALALSGTYIQNPELGHGNLPHSKDQSVQSVPQLDAFLHKGRIIQDFPLEIQASAQAGYKYRRHGTRGAKYEINPRLTLPISSPFGSIIASAGIKETYYDTERASFNNPDNPQGRRQNDDNRSIPEFSVAGFTEVARIYTVDEAPMALTRENVGKDRTLALRHSLQPRVEYNYIDNENQRYNPWYDLDDRLKPQKELTYSLTSVLTRKRETVVSTKDKEGNETLSFKNTYDDLVRFRIEQGYDFRESTRSDDRDDYSRRPFSDVMTELDIYLHQYFTLYAKNDYSPYLNSFTRHQIGGRTTIPQVGGFSASYDMRKELDEYNRKRDEEIGYMRFDAYLEFTAPFTIAATWKIDTENSDNHEKELRVIYNHQCFQVIAGMSIAPEEERYNLSVVLSGLGD